MRLILFTLLLVVAANGGFLSKIKETFSGEGSIGQKLKNATIITGQKLKNATVTGLTKIFGEGFLKIRDKFRRLKEKVVKTLKLTSEQLKSLQERLKKWRPIKNDKVAEKGDSIEEINDNSHIAEDLYQGDVVLTMAQADEIAEGIEDLADGVNRTKRQAFKDRRYPQTLWSEGVSYYFHPLASREMRSAFIKGAKWWEKDTCINFAENRMAKDRIMVFPENGCWSYVGKLGGEQKLSLGSGCESVSTAAHEIGHALGFFHTMSRYDRDEFITVNTVNIKADWLNQFNKETPQTNDNYGMTYDYGSLLHYGGTSASFNKKPTMVPFDVNYQQTLGSPFISFIELSMLNEHYKCKERCDPRTSVKCEMGGFPHPRDCRKCICPGGYGGARCTERPSGCGEKIQASTNWVTLEDVVGNNRENEDFLTCNYWIESPVGTVIQVRLLDFTKGLSVDGCKYAGVEIKTNKDQTLTGYRFCSPDAAGLTLQSFTNRVPIMTYNRLYKSKTVLEYRYVPQGSTVPPPLPPTTTRNPLIGGLQCTDESSICSSLVRAGFCDMSSTPMKTRMRMCGKSCNFC
uniref:Zinc metalloproteinase n=1 Tax=Haemonchus contortus TaxID=6289 RepID=A0A7I4Y550_HAECO